MLQLAALTLPNEMNTRSSAERWAPVLRAAVLAGVAAPLVTLCFALRCRAASPAPGPTLTYIKVLKGSSPEYEKIVVSADGSGSYDGRQLAEAPSPRPFRLSPGITQQFFLLARELHDFQDISLESHKRVADLGQKTFKYQDGERVYECRFNYSTKRQAGELENLFESLGAVERHISALDYAMRYDHLGLPRVLSLIQMDLDNKVLLDPQLMTGDLEAVANNGNYLHLAQVRAREILKQIQKDN